MIPVLLVTGFLGSGKTTMIARILADPAFSRSAVIVNEWGEIGLDHELIASSDETLLELSTGCLCCRVSSDLGRTFTGLAERAPGKYDRVIIETSGLADPAPILQALLTDPEITNAHKLLGTLTLIDTRMGEAVLARHPEGRRQVAFADRLLFTKTDLAPPSAALTAALDALNPEAPRLHAVRGDISPDLLFSASLPLSARRERLAEEAPIARHTAGIESFTLVRETPVPALALVMLLQALAENCASRLLRVKGLVDIAEMPGRPALIHGVQHIFEPPEWLPAWPSADHRTRLVFITMGVPRYFPLRLLAAIEEDVARETARQQPTPA